MLGSLPGQCQKHAGIKPESGQDQTMQEARQDHAMPVPVLILTLTAATFEPSLGTHP